LRNLIAWAADEHLQIIRVTVALPWLDRGGVELASPISNRG
jgi:hypothetical protein